MSQAAGYIILIVSLWICVWSHKVYLSLNFLRQMWQVNLKDISEHIWQDPRRIFWFVTWSLKNFMHLWQLFFIYFGGQRNLFSSGLLNIGISGSNSTNFRLEMNKSSDSLIISGWSILCSEHKKDFLFGNLFESSCDITLHAQGWRQLAKLQG